MCCSDKNGIWIHPHPGTDPTRRMGGCIWSKGPKQRVTYSSKYIYSVAFIHILTAISSFYYDFGILF